MLCRLANFSKCSLPTYVNFGLSIMKKLLDLSNENRLNILGGHKMDVSLTLKMAIFVLSYYIIYSNHSFCQELCIERNLSP